MFDTANKCGKKGTRFIHYMGHVKMMAAAQSFLSGAISKTINMPNEATVDDILEAYEQSWHQSLKAMAHLPRWFQAEPAALGQVGFGFGGIGAAGSRDPASGSTMRWRAAVGEAVAPRPKKTRRSRRSLRRSKPRWGTRRPIAAGCRLAASGFTQESRVAGHKVFLRTGEYEDGKLGEIFIDMHKEGAAFRSMINCFAIAISKGLQYGVPLDEFVETFTFTRFEPQGMVSGHPNIKMATSIIDYIFRVLGLEYLGRTDLAQVPPDLDDADDEEYGTPEYNEPFQAVTAESAAEAPADPVIAAIAAVPAAEPVTVKTNGNGHTNGNGKSGHSSYAELEVSYQYESSVATLSGALDAQLSEMMGDAPFCDNCGHITVRNGSCYRCLNCGNSLGCS